MRVYYTLTLIGAVIRGQKCEHIELCWDEAHISRKPFAISLSWAATREYILTHVSEITDLEEAHLEIAFS